MPRLLRSALVLTYMSETMAYCLPTQPCWPSSSEWESLGRVLTGTLTATATENWAECLAAAADSDAIAIASSANGICMQDTNCAYEYCDGDNAGKWDLPQVTAAVADVEDIKSVLSFCNQHNISVTVKTSGHSYAGSSTMKGSLLIWLHNLTKFGTVGPLTDSCGEVYQDVLKIGGGQPWGDAYLASAAAGRELVGGGGLTVSAAGGWLMGGGLSALSRKFGYGVDNVLRLEVVTTDAEAIVVDACSHGELFWALRGGGGGSFGVVTAAYYRTHEPAPVVTLSMNIDVSTAERDWWLVGPILESWIDFWVERSPSLSRDWAGGYWTLSSIVVLYYRGPLAEARATFIEPLEQWKASLTDWQQTYVTISVGNHTSFWASRTAACAVGMPEAGSAACLKYGATTDATGNANTNLRSRIVTHEYATRNGGADAKAALKWMLVNGFFTFNYFLGGAVNDVAPNATSVHPSVRASVWNWQVFDPRLVARMEAELPDSGICYNHAGHDQVGSDYAVAAWGSNLPRLEELKSRYDPDHRLNCFHCLGYSHLGEGTWAPTHCHGTQYECAAGVGTSPAAPAGFVDDWPNWAYPTVWLGTVAAVACLCCLVSQRKTFWKQWRRHRLSELQEANHLQLEGPQMR